MCLATTINPEHWTDPLNFEFMLNTFCKYFKAAKIAVNKNEEWGGRGLSINYLLLQSFKGARSYAFAVKDDIIDEANDVKKVLSNKKFSHVAHLFLDLEDLSETKAIILLRQMTYFKDWYNSL